MNVVCDIIQSEKIPGLTMMSLPTPPQTAYDQIEWLVKKFKALSKRERDAYNEDNQAAH